ncbi:hypothetical protein OIU34_23720 [Pararhizobium sp. BT-229]|uniref:hypothetical protein n=1 Tax=Pararhizobium sp. BT-229 TaxID=2986923 RepID=UPI0021F7CC10|nr:hypothetical protein [Pararhizobium sp. BT-229]MCV9964906.1 hypothetical protein [Pararhizobium sp. BT-229]
MKINWNKNPLRTTVELTDGEKEVFRLKVRIEQLEDAVGMAALHLEEDGKRRKYFRPEKAMAHLQRVQKDDPDDEYCADLLHELESGYHFGDCTCVPTSCAKCHAESLLGIDTIDGLRKHAAHYVDGAFGRKDERSIDEAIQSLADHVPVRSGAWLELPQEQFDANVATWKKQAEEAHEWLTRYRDTRLNATEIA